MKNGKKIAILTFYMDNINFGGMLQAYALQFFLESLGYRAEQIQYDYHCMQKDSPHLRVRVKCYVKNILFAMYQKKIKNRENIFRQFRESIPHTEKKYTYENINQCTDQFDCFICGGDQIWNDWGLDTRIAKNFLLDFVPENKKKISYSVSIGREHCSEKHLDILAEVDRFDGVSVREHGSIDILRALTNKEIIRVVDPVLLLSREQWESGLPQCSEKEAYALCYFLTNCDTHFSFAERYATEHKLNIVYFPFMHGTITKIERQFKKWKANFEAGPMEFVSLVKNAQCIFTDSFHAVVFSILFKKDFYVFERKELVNGENMNIRITELLSEYNLVERFVDSAEYRVLNPIDFGSIDGKLDIQIQNSKKWISENLNE